MRKLLLIAAALLFASTAFAGTGQEVVVRKLAAVLILGAYIVTGALHSGWLSFSLSKAACRSAKGLVVLFCNSPEGIAHAAVVMAWPAPIRLNSIEPVAAGAFRARRARFVPSRRNLRADFSGRARRTAFFTGEPARSSPPPGRAGSTCPSRKTLRNPASPM